MDQNFLQHWVSGFTAGFASTVALYPLDLLKIRMQVIESNRFRLGNRNTIKTISQISSKAANTAAATATTGTVIGDGAYNSMYTAIQLIVRQEGVIGLYRGLVPAVIASSGSWGGYFYFYEYFKQRNAQLYGSGNSSNKSTIHLMSGCQAGACLVLIFNPLWVVKTRLTLQGAVPSARQYTGLINAFTTMFKEEGIMGFYKGVVPAILLTSHGAIQFTVYEQLKLYGQNQSMSMDKRQSVSVDGSKSQSPTMSIINGALSKIVATITTYPYQVIKSRLQQGDSLVPRISNSNSGSTNVVTCNHHPAQLLASSASSSSSAATLQTHLYDSLVVRNNNSSSGNNIVTNIHNAVKYTDTVDCVRKVWKYEGVTGFFRGVVPCALRSAPSAGITLLVYEETLRFLRKHKQFN